MPATVDHGRLPPRLERRRFLGLLGASGLVAGGAAAGHLATALPSAAAEAEAREDGAYVPANSGSQQILWSVETDQPAVALTFDDGPNGVFTPIASGRAAAAGAQATFFVIGEQIANERRAVPPVAGRGPRGRATTPGATGARRSSARLETRAEIDRATDALTAATGTPPRWYRPPRGMLTGSAAEHAHLRGQGVVMWSADRGPAADTDADGVRRHLVDHLRPGAIIDLHDGVGASAGKPTTEWPATLIRRRSTELQVLPDVLAAGAASGLRFVTVSDLVDNARR